MKYPINLLLVLAFAVVLLINNIHSVEAGRVLKKHDLNLLFDVDGHYQYGVLLSSLQRGRNRPSAPNPKYPSTIDDRAFAGHPVHPPPPPPLPRAETGPRGSVSA